MDYTDAQRAAIGTLDEPLLIVACAGSGKTQVISQRIAEILKLDGVEPKNIVAFTFTEKAAAELKERVTTLVTAELGDVTGMAEMFIGTMHGYARDLLQSWVADAFKRNVLSDIQTRLFIDRNSRASGLTVTDAWVNGTPKKLRRYVNSPLWMQVLGILREDDVDETPLPDELKASRDGYRRLLSAHNYFDFTELLRVAVDLLGEDGDDEIAGALAGLRASLDEMEEALQGGDRERIEATIATAAAARERLESFAYRTAPAQLNRIRIRVPDRPGVLARITQILGAAQINLEDFELRHVSPEYGGVLVILVAGSESAERARELLRREGYAAA